MENETTWAWGGLQALGAKYLSYHQSGKTVERWQDPTLIDQIGKS